MKSEDKEKDFEHEAYTKLFEDREKYNAIMHAAAVQAYKMFKETNTKEKQ